MKHLLFFLLVFPFLASAQILEKQFVATVQYNGFTQINDSLYRGDLIEFRDVLIEGYQPSGVDSGFICLDGTGRAYRVEVVNSFDYSSLNVDLVELDDYDEIPIGVGIVAERYGSTYQIPNGLVNSIGISSVIQAKILNHNTKIAASDEDRDSTNELQNLVLIGTVLNITDGNAVDFASLFANYLLKSDSTTSYATRYYTRTNPTTIAANAVPRSNGSNLVAGNITDNGSRVVMGLPMQLKEYSLAGLPTGVTKDMYWITGAGPAWHQAARLAYAWESTASTFTSGSLIFANANGQAAQDNTNLFFNSSTYSLRLGGSGAADRIEFGANNGSGIPYITLFNAGLSTATLSLSNTLSSLQLNVGLDVNGAITATSRFKAIGLATIGSGQTNTGNSAGGQLILRPNAGSPGYINFTENATAFWANLGVDNANGDLKYETSPGGESNWEAGTTRFVIKQNGRVGIGPSTTVNYGLDVQGTDAIGIPRGTVGTQPAIVSNTTPLRFFTDTAALAYGHGGVYNFLATRPYVRSLFAATTWLKPELEARDVNITGTGKAFTVTNSKFRWKDRGYFGADSTIHFYPDLQLIYLRGTIPRMYISGSHPTYPASYILEQQGGASYEWLIDRASIFGLNNHTAVQAIRLGSTMYAHTVNSLYYKGKKNLTSRYGNIYGFTDILADFIFIVGDSLANNSSWVYTVKNQSANHLRINNSGTIEMAAYGQGLKQTPTSPYIAGFSSTGTLTDYRVRRDTFTQNANFTITSTLLSTCQELLITAEATAIASDFVTINLPTPSADYANKRVEVYTIDASATYGIVIDGTSNGLYYSTNTSTTAPSAATTFSPTTSKGATYVFTCTRNPGGAYFWKLQQN
jgi:hypothetical protein